MLFGAGAFESFVSFAGMNGSGRIGPSTAISTGALTGKDGLIGSTGAGLIASAGTGLNGSLGGAIGVSTIFSSAAPAGVTGFQFTAVASGGAAYRCDASPTRSFPLTARKEPEMVSAIPAQEYH